MSTSGVDQPSWNTLAAGVSLIAVVASLCVAALNWNTGLLPLFSIVVGATVSSIALEYYDGDDKKHLAAIGKSVGLLGAIAIYALQK